MATDKQKKEFGVNVAYGIKPPPKIKPTHGNLVEKIGNKVNILEENKPFALLQVMKRNYINKGYKPSSLKITY